MEHLLKHIDCFLLESELWVAERKTKITAYDFQFTPLFRLSRPRIEQQLPIPIVARIGAIADYKGLYDDFLELGLQLVNSPEEHTRASELEAWYPFIKEFTPKSKTYSKFPDLETVKEDFDFPIFIKGSRQTAKHDPALSIAKNKTAFEHIKKAYQNNSILHWQDVVCRAYVSLQPLAHQVPNKVPLSYEFRTFWWKGVLVGEGNYWSAYLAYTWSSQERQEALLIAQEAAKRLSIPFLVIDMALTATGNWIIIECNDAQESGYAGVVPLQLWQNIIEKERYGIF